MLLIELGHPAARCLAGPAFAGSLQYELRPERQTVMQQTAASSGQTLRQLAGGEAGPAPADAKTAAAEAALRRVGAVSDSAAPAQRRQPPQVFSRGDLVLYTQRDGTLEQAKVGAGCSAWGLLASACSSCLVLAIA